MSTAEGLATDGNALYWTEQTDFVGVYNIYMRPLEGEPTKQLAHVDTGMHSSSQNRWAVVDDTAVFWVAARFDRDDGMLWRTPLTGGETNQLSASVGCGIAADETHIFTLAKSGVVRCPKAGGDCGTVMMARSSRCSIAVDTTHVYWIDDDKVQSAPKGGGPTMTIATEQSEIEQIAVDTTHLFWRTIGAVFRAPRP